MARFYLFLLTLLDLGFDDTYFEGNGSPPVGDKPSLMTFREVETLFHETGHGLQHMLTTADVGDVAGINGVEWDAGTCSC